MITAERNSTDSKSLLGINIYSRKCSKSVLEKKLESNLKGSNVRIRIWCPGDEQPKETNHSVVFLQEFADSENLLVDLLSEDEEKCFLQSEKIINKIDNIIENIKKDSEKIVVFGLSYKNKYENYPQNIKYNINIADINSALESILTLRSDNVVFVDINNCIAYSGICNFITNDGNYSDTALKSITYEIALSLI